MFHFNFSNSLMDCYTNARIPQEIVTIQFGQNLINVLRLIASCITAILSLCEGHPLVTSQGTIIQSLFLFCFVLFCFALNVKLSMIWDALILIWRRCHETNQELPGTEVINSHINSRYMSGYVLVCPISWQLMWSYRIYNWSYDVSEAEYKKLLRYITGEVMTWYFSSWWRHQMGTFSAFLAALLTGDRWIPRTKASDEELWCFLWSAPE